MGLGPWESRHLLRSNRGRIPALQGTRGLLVEGGGAGTEGAGEKSVRAKYNSYLLQFTIRDLSIRKQRKLVCYFLERATTVYSHLVVRQHHRVHLHRLDVVAVVADHPGQLHFPDLLKLI